MYQTDTDNEAKRLRATTLAIAKLEAYGATTRELYWKKLLFDSTPKIISYFGCTNNIMPTI